MAKDTGYAHGREPDSHPSLEDLGKNRVKRLGGRSPIENRKVHLIAYLRDCISTEDWHGVSDAANDLREIAVEQRIVKTLFKSHEGQDYGPIMVHTVK